MNASKMNVLVSFWKRGDGDEGFGTITPGAGPWAEVFKDCAEIDMQPGQEQLFGGGVVGNNNVVIRLRYHAGTAALDNTYEVRIVETGQKFNVKGAGDPTMKRREVRVLAAAI
jgi:head-tail adaptor